MLKVWDVAKLHPALGSGFLLSLTMRQPKGQGMSHCSQLLSPNVGKSDVALSQKNLIGHEILGDKMHWCEPALQGSGAVTSLCYLILTCKLCPPMPPNPFSWQHAHGGSLLGSWMSPLQAIRLNPSPLFVAPTRLTHRPRSSSRAFENLLWQRWHLDQYKDNGQNDSFEGLFALISRSDFDNQLTPLLRAQHQDTFCIPGAAEILHLESRADISKD